ncbi:MAG: hypothetical protein Q8R61_06975 [Thiobacillus sp.]|uniref:hypothetical protein n=1 Tax=Thiobacillus sp. TaxID=924 RepID=UPI002734DC5C|nr:hypothetical protein [Thiobacillus sp.]MDP3584848.1 hypothetical protein [Thiobacillus sp.]
MNTEQQPEIPTNTLAADHATADTAADAETRLQLKREAVRLRLAQQKDDALGQVGVIARMAVPLARQMVRQHPYATLSSAALVGIWMIRGKPWRALGGSVLAGLLARQALAYSLSSGSQLVKHLIASDRAKSASGRPL